MSMAQFLKLIKDFMKKEWLKSKAARVIAGAVLILFIVWEMFGLSPSAVRVLDSRVTFKFTTFQDRDQYFVSCSLENIKKSKVKATIRVQLGEERLGGRIFHLIQAQTDTVVLDPLEIKAFVTQIDIPKRNNNQRELVVRAKTKHVFRF